MNPDLKIDNRSLVEECQKGDKEALNLFYTRFAPKMFGVIRRYVSNPKDAEDILHDGFIVAFTRLGSLRDFDRVDYWLASIMKNLSLQFLHSQDVAGMLHDLPDMEDVPEIDEIIDLEVLEKLIRKLPDGYQKVFRLAVLENKSHKEIAGLLGIAPNTSSSQLFHAKLAMRKLITEYRRQTGLLTLLLLLTFGGILLWNNADFNRQDQQAATRPDAQRDAGKPSVSSNEQPLLAAAHPSHTIAPATSGPGRISQFAAKTDKAPKTDSVNNDVTHVVSNEPSENDGIEKPMTGKEPARNVEKTQKVEKKAESVSEENTSTWYAFNDDPKRRKERNSGWKIGIGVNPGVAGFNVKGNDLNYDAANPGDPDENPDKDPDKDKDNDNGTRASAPFTRSDNQYRDYNDVSHHHYMPVSFSLTANKSLSRIFSLETGITYSYLHSTFETSLTKSHCQWHYLGIPLRLNILTFSTGPLKLYGTVGGDVAIPLYAKALRDRSSVGTDLWEGSFRASVVWSLSASYGASIRLSDRIDFFFEPTLQYHFERRQKVPNIWTDNSWGFSLPFGFRFSW